MFTDPPLRVLRLVKEAVKNSNANHVLEEINQANLDVGSGYRISRSLMRGMLSNPDGVAFTRKHLVALHIYFRATQGISFQHTPILESRGIYEALGDKQRLVFMYGAKPRPEEQRTDNSRWDTRSNGVRGLCSPIGVVELVVGAVPFGAFGVFGAAAGLAAHVVLAGRGCQDACPPAAGVGL